MTTQDKTKILVELNKKAIELSEEVQIAINTNNEQEALELSNQITGLYIAFDIINAMGE